MVSNARITCPHYTVSEEIGNAVSHGAGAALGLFGTVLMLIKAAGTPLFVVAAAIYGATMILLFTMSALYHSITNVRAKRVLRVMDHTTIYLLIAGTYTPFTLITLRGAIGWSVFGVVWGAAVLGIVLNLISLEKFKIASMIGYVASGWCIVAVFMPLVRAMAWQGVMLLLLGGLFYTTGLIFYARQKRVRFSHMIWHFFVLAGAVSHFFCIYWYVL